MTECKAKGLLSFNKEVTNWEVMSRGKNKHFKIKLKHFILAKFGTGANILESNNIIILSKESSEKYRSFKNPALGFNKFSI